VFGSWTLTSVAIMVAVTRYRLYAVDRLLSATVVYGLLSAAVVLVDIAVFAAAGTVLGQRSAALAAVAVVAVAYAPLRQRLWSGVRRMVRGSRDDPYGVVSALAERLEASSAADDQVLAVAKAVATAFRSPYVRVEIDQPHGGRLVVEHGSPDGREVVLPVAYRDEPVGRLVLQPAAAQAATRDVASILADVRRVVHDLRPPALDELGLLGAIRQQTSRFAGTVNGLDIQVTGDDALADLPAAVEVAAYRIVVEAITNAVRHARATRCTVRLSLAPLPAALSGANGPAGLRIEVQDDGTGIAPDLPAGVGLVSQRERAAELGGTCEVTCAPDGGTTVRAVLPIR
jgi:signal transduction histidine kinase